MGKGYSLFYPAGYGATATSGCTGFHFLLLGCCYFLLFEVILAVCAICTAGRMGFYRLDSVIF